MTDFKPQDTFQKVKKLPWRELEGSVVIVDINTEECLSFNELASFIWQNIDGKNSISDIITQIIDQYDVNQEQAEKDTKQFLKTCHEKGLIENV